MSGTIKITNVPNAGVLTGTERVPVVDGTVTKQVSTQQIADLAPSNFNAFLVRNETTGETDFLAPDGTTQFRSGNNPNAVNFLLAQGSIANGYVALAAQLKAQIAAARLYVTNNPASCEANTILHYAWNECDEGQPICPTLGNSGGMALA